MSCVCGRAKLTLPSTLPIFEAVADRVKENKQYIEILFFGARTSTCSSMQKVYKIEGQCCLLWHLMLFSRKINKLFVLSNLF